MWKDDIVDFGKFDEEKILKRKAPECSHPCQ